jgi:hypothetical protein
MLKYLAENWLAIAGLVGTVGFGILSVVFYFRGIQKPIPTFAVHPLRTRIVDKSKTPAPGLEVLHRGFPITANNVTAATAYFWNAGPEPIRKTDVLTPYTVDLGSGGTLLEVEATKTTRPVCQAGANMQTSASRR